MSFFRNKKTLSTTVIVPRRNRKFRKRDHGRTKATASKPFRWSFVYVFLWLIFLVSLPVFAFFSPLLRINTISFSSNVLPVDDAIRASVKNELSRPLLHFIPGDTFFVVQIRRADFSSLLLQQFPALRTVSIAPSFPNTMRITIEMRRPTVMLCSAGPCFLVDDQGVAYSSVSEEKDADILRIIDESGKPISLRDPVLSPELVSYAEDIRSKLSDDVGINVGPEARTPSRLSNELRFQTAEGWELRVDAGMPLDRLIAELHLLFLKTLPNASRSSLIYLDLRAPGKAFYLDKLSEEAKSEEISPLDDALPKTSEKKKKK